MEINIEIKSGELIAEYHGKDIREYFFETDESKPCHRLETKLNTNINNFIIDSLGARSDLRLGRSIDLIMIDNMIFAVLQDGEMVFAEYYNESFDGREKYLQERYGISKEELMTLAKQEMKTRKLEKIKKLNRRGCNEII